MYNTSDQFAIWWITIGIGITTVLCVIVLLSLVTAFVNDIAFHVAVVVEEVNHVTNNTVTSADLHEAARQIAGLGAELEAQIAELEKEGGYL